VPARGSDADATRQALAGTAIDGAAVPGFTLAIDPATTRQTGNPATSVCCNAPGYIWGLWGTYIGGDAFVGTLKSETLPVTASYWYVPVLGYPSRPGNHLYVEAVAAGGTAIQRSTFHAANPGEALGLWRIDLRRFAGGTARVFLEDGTADATGWLGVGAPIATERAAATVEDLTRGPTNYARYWLSGLVLAALIFIPGLALRRWRTTRIDLAVQPTELTALLDEPLLLPIPGLLLLAVYGLLLWLLDAGNNGLARHILLLIEAALAAWSATSGRAGPDREVSQSLARKNPNRGPSESALGTTRSTSFGAMRSIPKEYSQYWVWGIYLAAVILAAAYSIVRRPVTQEENRGSSFQSRMVASPPDHLIPYRTAVYFHTGYDGVARSAAYFGSASVATRGPLAPLIVNAAFNVLRIRPLDPPDATADAWPAAADGFYAARWIAFLTNACAIAGVAALTLALGGPLWFAALWAAAAPVTFVNVAFAWPKLFAAYFLLLALAECLRGRPAYRWGLWTALAYLAHPVGGLFAVPLLIFAARTRGWKPALQCAAVAGLCLLPWLAFRHALSPADGFARYPLGDGRGAPAALSAGSWLKARLLNLWYTVVPGAFTLSPLMRAWTRGPLSSPARWAIQYAKTLPGNLGYYGCALAYFALARLGWAQGRSRTSPAAIQFAQWFLLPCLLTLLIYWGYSSDGLGRDCLEPLSLAVLAWSASACSLALRPGALMLGFVAIETMTMVAFGFL
jgi:hypothetical protein